MKHSDRALRALLSCSLLGIAAGCGGGGGGGGRAPVSGSYADFLAVSTENRLIPGDTITVANDWGAYRFTLSSSVHTVTITITGAGGSQGGQGEGGTGGTGTFNMTPAYLASQAASGFWIVLGEAGRPSAGEVGPIGDYVAYNGGGAATDWSDGENTYDVAGGGGGASDVRLSLAGSPTDPHFPVDPAADPFSRFAIVGGGGGGTDNDSPGGARGGLGLDGGDSEYDVPEYLGYGGTSTAGGNWGGTLAYGGNGLMDGTEGWAGGGGGGYYGGGAPQAHGGGGGGSGFLVVAPGISFVDTLSGTQGGNASTSAHGSFTITVN